MLFLVPGQLGYCVLIWSVLYGSPIWHLCPMHYLAVLDHSIVSRLWLNAPKGMNPSAKQWPWPTPSHSLHRMSLFHPPSPEQYVWWYQGVLRRGLRSQDPWPPDNSYLLLRCLHGYNLGTRRSMPTLTNLTSADLVETIASSTICYCIHTFVPRNCYPLKLLPDDQKFAKSIITKYLRKKKEKQVALRWAKQSFKLVMLFWMMRSSVWSIAEQYHVAFRGRCATAAQPCGKVQLG